MKGLTESTLDGWFKKTVELLKPLYEELKRELILTIRLALIAEMPMNKSIRLFMRV